MCFGRSSRTLGAWAAALALILVLAPAAPAAKKHRRAFAFGQRALSVGAKGKDVRFLQKALSRLGVSTGVDGAFGKGTFRSVKTFERQRGWLVDGRVTKKEAKRIKKLLARPRSGYYLFGLDSPALTLKAPRAGDATVKVSDSSGATVATLPVAFSGAGTQDVSWNGIGDSTSYVPDGTYQLHLTDPGTAKAAVTGGQTIPFPLHAHAFPVPGAHNFGGAGSRFGAPRGDHTHQGQDVAAACGERLFLAEGGIVTTNAYQAGGAGYYVVIHGAVSGTDYVYMHLKKGSWAPVGQTVYTNQQIGKVGNTGHSTGCHLHFEHWTYPGWYLGGAPYDPLPELLYWDTYS